MSANVLDESDDLNCLVDSFRGKPVSSERFMSLLSTATGQTLPGTRGIKIRLERLGNDRGASLLVTLVVDKPARKGLSPQLATRQTIIVDRTATMDGHGLVAGVGRTVSLLEIDWKGFAAKLQTALQCRPEQYLLVQVGCEEMR